MSAFKGLSDAATRPGELTAKLKELTAVAIAVAKGCDDCIVFMPRPPRSIARVDRNLSKSLLSP
jgi:alkylhydroperoxidase/carboxymuconolactone decarboxylase family protein YurZ